MNTLAFVNFLLIKIFPTLIRQNFPPSKFCAIRYDMYIEFAEYIYAYVRLGHDVDAQVDIS